MKGKKGQGFTLAMLALALCGAVYLNWSYTQKALQTVPTADQETQQAAQASAGVTDLSETQEPVSLTGTEAEQAVYDPLEAEISGTGESELAGKNYGEAQLVSVSKDSGTEFFEQARLSRSKARDEALDAIKKTLKNSELTDEEKKQITSELEQQVSSITTETTVENLIKAKGFADCVVSLTRDRADVTVMTENDALTAEEVTRIRDAVLNQCKGLSAQDITVVEVK
ncbi:MAG: SpoIIIAH-like family protein [Gemmiger sp.]|uniref:SpoIIIAH-like family protein n=1 Tax=Gemmiger sp. TaxID=2049027 RepID=UPI002A91C4A5|nr:SpoIIIAH-like family protein [Gemmiger sp.]MDY5326168.1 SpoIIIAH-like family protein [Gemmiger sp.]